MSGMYITYVDSKKRCYVILVNVYMYMFSVDMDNVWTTYLENTNVQCPSVHDAKLVIGFLVGGVYIKYVYMWKQRWQENVCMEETDVRV